MLSAERLPVPSVLEAFPTWARIALLSFGGPAGQIAVMHRILVEEKKWISDRRFLHALNYCMLLPGPEAHQLAVYIGWLMNRIWGGVVSGTLFVLPGLITLGLLSWIYAAFGQVPLVAAAFFGLKAAVLAIVLEAVQRIGRRALKTKASIVIAGLTFVAIFFMGTPFPLIILGAGIAGFLGQRVRPDWFKWSSHGSANSAGEDALIDRSFASSVPAHVKPSTRRFVAVFAVGAALWLGPLLVLVIALGPGNIFTAIAAFNSKMAVVTFGGAYAVLSYMAQQAVEHFLWLKPGEMLVGLGFAETTPGPLISVVQFVGFNAASRAPGALDPMVAGTLGGLLAMWSTFVPSFLWIFLGGPYIEALIGNKALNAALSAITAAVVGVVLNLAVWFALQTLFHRVDSIHFAGLMFRIPALGTVDWAALAIFVAAAIALFRLKIGVVAILAASCTAGFAFHFISLS